MFDKQKEMMKTCKPMIEDINRLVAPQLVAAFGAGYQLGRKNKEEK